MRFIKEYSDFSRETIEDLFLKFADDNNMSLSSFMTKLNYNRSEIGQEINNWCLVYGYDFFLPFDSDGDKTTIIQLSCSSVVISGPKGKVELGIDFNKYAHLANEINSKLEKFGKVICGIKRNRHTMYGDDEFVEVRDIYNIAIVDKGELLSTQEVYGLPATHESKGFIENTIEDIEDSFIELSDEGYEIRITKDILFNKINVEHHNLIYGSGWRKVEQSPKPDLRATEPLPDDYYSGYTIHLFGEYNNSFILSEAKKIKLPKGISILGIYYMHLPPNSARAYGTKKDHECVYAISLVYDKYNISEAKRYPLKLKKIKLIKKSNKIIDWKSHYNNFSPAPKLSIPIGEVKI